MGIDFRALEDEVMIQTFEETWRISISERDGARTYAGAEARKMFESFGINWRRVARLSTIALDNVYPGLEEEVQGEL